MPARMLAALYDLFVCKACMYLHVCVCACVPAYTAERLLVYAALSY